MKALLLACLLISALQAEQPAKEIARIRVAWADDLRSKKIDEITNLYAEDGVFLQPNGTRVTGKSAIRDLMKQVTGAFNSDITLQSVSVEISGKLAYDSGDYQETMTPISGGSARQLKGTYLTVLRRGPDGRWRIIQQLWSGN